MGLQREQASVVTAQHADGAGQAAVAAGQTDRVQRSGRTQRRMFTSHSSLGQSAQEEGCGARLGSLLRADRFVSGVMLRSC